MKGKGLRGIVLRASDKGTINGKFQVHFRLGHQPVTNITWELCDAFNEKVNAFAAARDVACCKITAELDEMFENFFEISLQGEHVTRKLWKEWRKAHEKLLTDIVSQRSQTRRASDKGSG